MPGTNNLSIVVVGTMNPAIHHPFWYEMIGALTADERDEALGSPLLVVAPVAGQFAWRDWVIVCAPDRWEMRTAREDRFDRVLSIASSVFERLTDTPVTAFGINIDLLKTKPLASSRLAEALATRGFGLDAGAIECAYSAKWREARPSTRLTRIAAVSTIADDPTLLKVANNFHHDIDIPGAAHFDLTPLLRPAVEEALVVAREQTARVEALYPGAI